MANLKLSYPAKVTLHRIANPKPDPNPNPNPNPNRNPNPNPNRNPSPSPNPSQVLGCDPAILQRVLPAAFGSGCDREGQPLVFKHFGAQCKLRSLLEHTSVQHLARYNAWLNEQLTLCLRDAAASRWTITLPLTPARALAPAPTVFPFLTLTSWTIVIDALGWLI